MNREIKNTDDFRIISIEISKDLEDKLNNIAKSKSISLSDLINEIL